MNIFKFSVGSEAKRVAVRCVFAIGVVCWASCFLFFFLCRSLDFPSRSKTQKKIGESSPWGALPPVVEQD